LARQRLAVRIGGLRGDADQRAAARADRQARAHLVACLEALAAAADELDAHGARKVLRNATTWACSAPLSRMNACAARVPWPPCCRIASTSVGARPSCRYGAESATPHKGGVRHSVGEMPSPDG